jgi:TRAP-type mannitol/chloroaromatic compound transport system permease large subunit
MLKPTAAPALPISARPLQGRALWASALRAILPPLLLIFLVLGTIFLGWATPTEGGAMGATGALLLAWARRRLPLHLLKQALDSTTRLSSFVMFILIGSTVFSLVFRGVNGFLIVVNLLVFVLAFFLDFFEIAFIIIPLLAPVAQKLGIDLIWFGVLIGINMQTSFMHPPFGFALFYLRSVAPKTIKTTDIYRGAIPFVIIQLVMVALVIAFPNIASSAKPQALSSGVIEVPMAQDSYGDYYLPKEWR